MSTAQTLFDKIFDRHVVASFSDGRKVIAIDRHILQETACAESFDGLRESTYPVRDLDLTWAVIDHSVSTEPGRTASTEPRTAPRIALMQQNCKEYGIRLYDVNDSEQGIVHTIGPELGIALPGSTVVCADSHTATSGGLGAWAWGIGATQVLHVLATQTLIQTKPKRMRVTFNGKTGKGVFGKDLILRLIAKYGTITGTGYAIEYAGSAIETLPVEGRLTVCNMSIEFGARTGMIAVDDKTIEYVAGRPFAPKGEKWDAAMHEWRVLHSDDGAVFDQELDVNCAGLHPQISWGNSPQDTIAVDELIPDPTTIADTERRELAVRALKYMDLRPGARIEGIPIQYAFIGSCTNSRLSDLQEAASVARQGKVAPGVRALVVPGSTQVKLAAEALGLDRVFEAAGFEWRESGCSMCVAGNGDVVPPGQRCVSTSNRNFENRQGPGSRTHLASPASVAAAAISGHITDVRRFYN
jgi:3-isopropylmalate/(R)-2-methylmalate dehydratase large subunit